MLKIILFAVLSIQLIGAIPLSLEKNRVENGRHLSKRNILDGVKYAGNKSTGSSAKDQWIATSQWYRENGKNLYYNSTGVWFRNGTFFRRHDELQNFWQGNGKNLYYNRTGIWFANGTFFSPYSDYSDKFYNSSGIWFRNGTFWRAYDDSKESQETPNNRSENRNITRPTDKDFNGSSLENSKSQEDSRDKSAKTKSVDDDSRDKSAKSVNSAESKESEESKESQASDDDDSNESRKKSRSN